MMLKLKRSWASSNRKMFNKPKARKTFEINSSFNVK